MDEERHNKVNEDTHEDSENHLSPTQEKNGNLKAAEYSRQDYNKPFISVQESERLMDMLENINNKIDIFLNKIEESRIEIELKNQKNFKRLLNDINDYLSENFNKTVDSAVKNEIKNINQQSKSFIESCMNGIENKYNETLNKLTDKCATPVINPGKPEPDLYLQNFKSVLVNNLVPVVESCFEEIRLQVLDSCNMLSVNSVNDASIMTISIHDEVNALIRSDKINDAAMLAMDCDDDTFIVFLENINSEHIDNINPSLLSKLFTKAIQICKENSNVPPRLFIYIEVLTEGFGLKSMNAEEIEELIECFADLECIVEDNESLKQKVRFQKRRCEAKLSKVKGILNK